MAEDRHEKCTDEYIAKAYILAKDTADMVFNAMCAHGFQASKEQVISKDLEAKYAKLLEAAKRAMVELQDGETTEAWKTLNEVLWEESIESKEQA